MKSPLISLLLLLLLLCSCKNQNKAVVTVIDFEANAGALFSPDRLNPAAYTPFQTVENAILESKAKLILAPEGYFMFNRIRMEVLGFDQSGKFLYKIGAKGNGPGEYTDIQDFWVNPEEKSIEVLSMSLQKVLKYRYTGEYLSQFSIPGYAFSFARLRNGDYIFGKGVAPDNTLGTSQAFQTDPAGNVRCSHLAVVNTGFTTPFYEESIQSSNGNSYLKSWLNGNIYKLTDTVCTLVTHVDFKDKKLKENALETTPDAFFDLILNTKFYSIDRYLENDDYIYFFTTSGDGTDMRHVLYEKRSGKSFVTDFAAANKTFTGLDAAKALTPANELIFIAEPFILKELVREQPELFPAVSNGTALDDYSNGVLIKFKII